MVIAQPNPCSGTVVETAEDEELPDVAGFTRVDDRRYGEARLRFLSRSGDV